MAAYRAARADLLAERTGAGHWVGWLSSSALSTATAVSALSLVAKHAIEPPIPPVELRRLIDRGIDWIAPQQNGDGGWGDTPACRSNIATTMLARAAIGLAGREDAYPEAVAGADRYIEAQGGLAGLRRRYGKDKTFAVPILTNSALAGLVPWAEVSPLPFELACLPHAVYRFLRLPVVSYAIPALVAIGQARFFKQPPRNPLTRTVRAASVGRSLEVLQRMQPESGGFLEATPLSSFVVMSLAATGRADHAVVRRGVEFLVQSIREDGSWPIDTNLATWCTTLAINALMGHRSADTGQTPMASDASTGDTRGVPIGSDTGATPWPRDDFDPATCLDWLLGCQHARRHPFTQADPGGWGWTDLSGAVPDADDTAGALLALAAMAPHAESDVKKRIASAAACGLWWLLNLQNRDGGWPTFCRGWGKLPFDRSGADLTAHAIRAIDAWREADFTVTGPEAMESSSSRDSNGPIVAGGYCDRAALDRNARQLAVERGLTYLARRQRADGSWVPLWFGNEHHPAEENPIYGTARVLLAYRDLDKLDDPAARRGLAWLAAHQNADGGWGGAGLAPEATDAEMSSVEETAVALESLLAAGDDPTLQTAARKGLQWLVACVERGGHRRSAPIGFYFAKLWYDEKLYPPIFTVSALGRALAALG